MFKMRFFWALAFFPTVLQAQLSSSVFSVLNLPSNSRDAFLSNITSSIMDSSFSQAQNNLALISDNYNGYGSLTYGGYVADIHSGNLNYAFKHKKFGMIMPSLQYFYQGKYTETNEFGDIIREFSGSDLLAGLAVSNAFLEHFRYGIQARFMYSQYLQYSALGISTDYVIHYSQKPSRYGISLSVLNLGLPFKNYVRQQTEPLPLNIQLSSSFKLSHSPLVIHMAYNYLQKWDLTYDPKYLKTNPFSGEVTENTFTGSNFFKHINLAVDFVPSSKFRVGISYDYKRRSELKYSVFGKLAGFGFGIGLKTKKFNIDYTLYGNGVGLFSNFITISTNILDRIRK